MTILTKPSIVIKKPDGTKSPLVLDGKECSCDEDKVDIYPVAGGPSGPAGPAGGRRPTVAVLCVLLVSGLVMAVGITAGVLLYRQYLRSSAMHRYQGFCSIPIDPKDFQQAIQMHEQDQLIESNYHTQRLLTPQWSSEPFQVMSAGDEESSDEFVDELREQLDIGDKVERIQVKDNGRLIQFINDFEDNVTGIVDTERCFVMDMDPANILTPDLFVFGIEQGGSFDVTRVRTSLRAMLPALQELARHARLVAQKCFDKPTYRLQREEGVIIRKRAVDAPPHDYMLFAGRHVQMIEISNLADLLQHEKNQA